MISPIFKSRLDLCRPDRKFAFKTDATLTDGTAAMTDAANDISGLSFEDALKQLETIVRELEQGNVPLERSIDMYERGDALRKHCDTLLKSAEAKVEKIQLGQNGEASGTEALDPQ
jgi:exodeoxyribonuclease VII small subunit